MTRKIVWAVAAAVVATAYLSPASVSPVQAKTCYSQTIFAWGDLKRTWTGARASAKHNWRVTVRRRLDRRWDTWTRAELRSMACTESGRSKRCWARAQPCRLGN